MQLPFYLLQFTVCSALFALVYRVFLARLPMPAFNRCFLIASLIMPFILPLIVVEVPGAPLAFSAINVFTLKEAIVKPGGINVKGSFPSFTGCLICAYLIIATILVIALLRRHVAFNKLLKKSPVQQLGNTQIHIVAGYGPGSYNGRIFFPVSDINPLVLRHEQAHVQLNHHLDLWLLQCVRVIGWINPVVYYLGSQLILVHEYEADALAVNGNQMGYTQALLANVLGTRELTFTHAFFHHPIKNRILMLQRQTAGRTKMAAALLMLLMSGGIVVAQNVKPKVKAAKAHKVEKIYRQVEVMPEFKGDIGEWVRRQLEYPDAASEKGQEGRVIIEFVVARNGQIMRPKVVRQSGVPALDAEALRVVSLMPAWSPGKQNGVPVNTYFNLPFTFKLE